LGLRYNEGVPLWVDAHGGFPLTGNAETLVDREAAEISTDGRKKNLGEADFVQVGGTFSV